MEHLLKGLFMCEIQILGFIVGLNLQLYSLPPIIPQLCPVAGFTLAVVVAYPNLKTRFINWKNKRFKK